MKSNDVVCEACRPKYFYRNMFHFPIKSLSIRTSSFRKASPWETETNTYSVWITIFNNENKYNDDTTWLEEIDKKGNIITRTFLKDENNDLSNSGELHIIHNATEPDNNIKSRLYVVFGRDKKNISFYGVYKLKERNTTNSTLTLVYERIAKEFSYNIKDIPNFR